MQCLKSLAIMVLASGMTLGCATQGSVDKVANDLAAVRMEAQAAQQTAAEAKRAADEANNRSRATEEMLNRSFKKSMYK